MVRVLSGGPVLGSGVAFELEALLLEYCSRFGESVRDLLIQEVRTPAALSRVLRSLDLRPSGSIEDRVAALAGWIDLNGSRGLFRAMSEAPPDARNFTPRPVDPPTRRPDEGRIVALLLQNQRNTPPPVARSSAAATVSTPWAPPAPSPGMPRPPYLPYPNRPGAPKKGPLRPGDGRYRPENPISGSAPKLPPPIPSGGPFAGPPGYPYPWPPYLKPGPEPPPNDVPPEKLTWPYVDRRTGVDRRKGKKDRRNRVDMVYKNRRFGGDRRKGDRRKNGGGTAAPS